MKNLKISQMEDYTMQMTWLRRTAMSARGVMPVAQGWEVLSFLIHWMW